MTSNRYLEKATIETLSEIIHDTKLTSVEIGYLLEGLADVVGATRTGQDQNTVMELKKKLYGVADFYAFKLGA